MHRKTYSFRLQASLRCCNQPYSLLLLLATEAQKNQKKRGIFKWVAACIHTKTDGKKQNLNLTIKRTSVPKKIWSFLAIHQKSSLVTDEWIETKRKWKPHYNSDLPLLWVINSEKIAKKTTIKWTFLPWKMAGNFSQSMSNWKWKEEKENRKKRSVWEGCFFSTRAHSPVHLHHGDLCATLQISACCATVLAQLHARFLRPKKHRI